MLDQLPRNKSHLVTMMPCPYPSLGWEPRRSSSAPSPGEVHIWRWQLDQDRADIDGLRDYLDDVELGRAERFHFCRDREHFIVAHGLLRVILGGYLGIHPAHVSYLFGHYGKPEIDPRCYPNGLSFNLSHAGGLALLAVTIGARIGVDLEFVRPDLPCEEIAEQFFSRPEIASLRALPSEMRAEAFFQCWTRKEAYVKARGQGLSYPLGDFTVSLDLSNAELVEVTNDPRDRERWILHSLIPDADYVAALAVERVDSWMLCPSAGDGVRQRIGDAHGIHLVAIDGDFLCVDRAQESVADSKRWTNRHTVL